jgi:hypothetical protein
LKPYQTEASEVARPALSVLVPAVVADRYLENHPREGRPPEIKPSFVSIIANSTLPVLGTSLACMRWTYFSRKRGLVLLNDHIHFNEISAGMMVDLLSSFVERVSSDFHGPQYQPPKVGGGRTTVLSLSGPTVVGWDERSLLEGCWSREA